MTGLTFSGKPASQVAIRSPHLPLLDPAIEAKRDERRAKEVDRLDRTIQAARWRGEQVNYLRERVRRLQPIQERLNAWLDSHDWKHPLWPKRIDRYWHVATIILAHEREMRGFIDKFDDLVRVKLGVQTCDSSRKKAMAQQERITAAYFEAMNAPPPVHRSAQVGMIRGENNG